MLKSKRQVDDAKEVYATVEAEFKTAKSKEEIRLDGAAHSTRVRLEGMLALAKADWVFRLQAIGILAFLLMLETLGWVAKLCGVSVLGRHTKRELQQAQYDALSDTPLADMRTGALGDVRSDGSLINSVQTLELDKAHRIVSASYARDTANQVAKAAGLSGAAQDIVRNTAALHAVAGGLATVGRSS